MPEWVRISFRPNDEDTLWQSTLVSAQTPPIKKWYLQTENLPESKNIYMHGQEQYYFLYCSVWLLWTARNSWRRWLYYPPGSLPRPVVCPRAINCWRCGMYARLVFIYQPVGIVTVGADTDKCQCHYQDNSYELVITCLYPMHRLFGCLSWDLPLLS